MKKHKGFPMFAVILLIVGVFWALREMNMITINMPWLPVILIIISIGMIVNRCRYNK